MPGPLLFLLVVFGSIVAFVGALLAIGFAFAGIASLFSSGGRSDAGGLPGGGSSTRISGPFGSGNGDYGVSGPGEDRGDGDGCGGCGCGG
ncbi:hypothetical protein ACFVH6_05700 [Spirillospora sp. NPDC127200]